MEIAGDKATAFADHARRFDAEDAMTDPSAGSDDIDDGMTDVQVDSPADAVAEELVGLLLAMNDDERAAPIALVRWGEKTSRRRSGTKPWHWRRNAGKDRRPWDLLGIPHVANLAEEGLALMTEEKVLPASRDAEDPERASDGHHPELDKEASDPTDPAKGP